MGKPYEFLYDEANQIIEARVVDINNYKEDAHYETSIIANYKGFNNADIFDFKQIKTPEWFEFKIGDAYVFLVFNKYQDRIFSTCFLFGNKEKMKGLLDIALSKCMGPTHEGGNCPRDLSIVCGCNGVTYGNDCEASKAGVLIWSPGKCEL